MEPKDKKKLTRSDIKELINDIEAKFPVDKWTINGIHIWPIIRIHLFMNLAKLYVIESPDYVTTATFTNRIIKILEILKGLSKFGFAYLADYKKNERPKKADVVFLDHGLCFTKVKNYWYDKLCGLFIDYFNKRDMSCFLMTALHEYSIPRYHQSMFVQPHLDYIKIKSRFILKLTRSWDEKLPNFLDFLDYLESKNFNIRKITLPVIREEIIIIRLVADFFKKLLEKSKPSLGFTVCYYGATGYAFNLACREFGIHSIDIQHGVQGDLHLAYGSWYRVPKTGYELLPSFFWCWSDFEANAIRKWSGKVSKWHKPIVGGNLWLNQWLYGNSKFVKHYDKIVSKLKKPNKNCRHILFTQNESIENKNFKNILYVIKNSPPSWFWWIRIHPCQLKIKPKVKKLLHENKISNCIVDSTTNLPLYALLRNIDIHVTCSSSTVIEAEIFDVPSVIVTPEGSKLFPNQISSGWATPAYTLENIISAINHQLEIKDRLRQNKEKHQMQKDDKLEYLMRLTNQRKLCKS